MLCVENHFGTMTQTAADTARLVREIDSAAVRVLYDQANLTFTHDETWQDAFAVQGELIGHVHVKDLVFKDPARGVPRLRHGPREGRGTCRQLPGRR